MTLNTHDFPLSAAAAKATADAVIAEIFATHFQPEDAAPLRTPAQDETALDALTQMYAYYEA